MHYASDNAGPAHPRVMEALARANEGYAMPYGAEAAMERVTDALRGILDLPQASVRLVATGTAANALALSVLAPPWSAIYCASTAHIEEDECNAPEFFTGGAKLALIDAPDGMIDANALDARIAATPEGSVHAAQRGAVSVTSVTERGTVYDLAQLDALTRVARRHGVPVHLDGARFANAVAQLGCAPREMARGIDAICFGATKNGCLGVEAVVLPDPAKDWEFALRRKRAGHLFSKHRYLSAQMEAYLEDGLWLDLASRANAACAYLADGLRSTDRTSFVHPPQANILYVRFPRAAHRRLVRSGAQFYSLGPLDGPQDEPVPARLVCDWSARREDAERFVEILSR